MNPLKRKNITAQVTVEYVVIIGFLIALTIGILIAVSLRLTQVDKDQKQNTVVYLQNLLRNEIERALSVEEGYSRTFELPKTLAGFNYTMRFDDDQLLAIKYREIESYVYLNATGNVCITSLQSSYNIKIQKNTTNLTFISCPECTTTFKACDVAEESATCSSVNRTECCNNHCRCC